eukprot:10427035-Ditylum_brightwellii.AAC.1
MECFLSEAPIMFKSKIMFIVVLSVTEAGLFAVVQCTEDMIYAIRVMNSMMLNVELPMVFSLHNKGSKDFVDNWSVGRKTRHIEKKEYWLASGRRVKTCHLTDFERYDVQFVGHDEYMDPGTHKGRMLE